MTPQELRDNIAYLFGESKTPQRDFAEETGKDECTISRYVTGARPIPASFAKLVETMVAYHRKAQKIRDKKSAQRARKRVKLRVENLLN